MKPSAYEVNLYSSENVLDKNITSFGGAITKSNFLDEYKIDHLYIRESIHVSNIEDYRYNTAKYDSDLVQKFSEYWTEEERKKRYSGEEDEMYCGRFPHLSYCGCKIPCSIALDLIHPIQMMDNIYVGPIEAVFKTKQLLGSKIHYVLNVSCTEYNKRKYFKFLDIYINDNHTENAIKFFKVTNRFIDEAVKSDRKVLIHSVQGKSRCWVFYLAYLIGRCRMKFVQAFKAVTDRFPYAEPNDNFLTQLKHYDLETNNLD
jgi:hypothetical protein